ncbi:MAG: S-methyl-5-thioribose-1-phosphate isomerase [Casimicrobiaceae bacterium]
MKNDDPANYRALIRPRGARHVDVIDQRALPHTLVRIKIASADAAALAIRKMWIRGAPLIGAVGAYGLALALDRDASNDALASAFAALDATRPTAVNLRWALERVRAKVAPLARADRADAAWAEADAIVREDVVMNRAIGEHGIAILRGVAQRRPGPVRVMTHCNAGALATCGWGTATSPIFLAHLDGLPLEVWVSETRPRMQGANLTAWELDQRGIPHTLVADSACALLMQRGDVDVVIVGADRVARNGDVCNKIGTYGKALAARESNVPFYVALPSPTVDWRLPSGEGIPIEVRDGDEVTMVSGRDDYGQTVRVAIAPHNTKAQNFAFDVTPARLVTGFVTERGITRASREWLSAMFPDFA